MSSDPIETDDFLKAKRLLESRLMLDDFVSSLCVRYMRDEVQPYKRFEAAKDIVAACQDKASPIGWLRTVLERGTLRAALGAIRGQSARKEEQERRNPGLGRRADVRAKLRELYEAVSGTRIGAGSNLLDDEGGLSWCSFAVKAPRLAQAIKGNLDRRMHSEMTTLEAHGQEYEAVYPVKWDDWISVIDEFLDADGARREAQVEVTSI